MEAYGGGIFLKLCGAALIFVVLSVVLGEVGRGTRLPVKLGGAVFLYGGVFLLLIPLVERLTGLMTGYALAPYGAVMLKALGIALLSQIVSDLCRDSGESTAASLVETAGKLVILLMALPLVEGLLEVVEGLL